MTGSILKSPLLLATICTLVLASCDTIDLFEKNVSIPGHEWSASYRPQFTFNIKDTTSPYQVFVVFRHTGKYNFNNIWLNLFTQAPGDTIQKVQYELPLANSEGWLGTAMDDLYEHRILITPRNQDVFFNRSGDYTFTIGHIMREDPLRHVMNIGLRIEKKPR